MYGNPFYFVLTENISLQLAVTSEDPLSTLTRAFTYRKFILLHTAPNQDLQTFHYQDTINNMIEKAMIVEMYLRQKKVSKIPQ